jgi:hypothetical protein
MKKRRTRKKRRKTKRKKKIKRNMGKGSPEQSTCISNNGEELNVGDIISFRFLMGLKKSKPGQIIEIKDRHARVKHKMYKSNGTFEYHETDFLPCGRLTPASGDFKDHWNVDNSLNSGKRKKHTRKKSRRKRR